MSPHPPTYRTPEHIRLEEARVGAVPWKAWGPYLSERQWGTVREDDSASGEAWDTFTHDQARSRAYRWGEDGIAGICDARQRLCLALVLWNGTDPILKERMFGLSNSEGNHGEDVKEYWFYLDSTPTHSYLKCQYKYPQRAFPYGDLVATNAARSRLDMEYELLDTGIFDEDRYFDVVVEYAKAEHDDILMLVTAHNRGPDTATLHLLPTLWYRNTWAHHAGATPPVLRAGSGPWRRDPCRAPRTRHVAARGRRRRHAPVLRQRDQRRAHPRRRRVVPVPEGCDQRVRRGRGPRCGQPGTSRHQGRRAPRPRARPGRERVDSPAAVGGAPGPVGAEHPGLGDDFAHVLDERRREADEFYATLVPPSASADQALVMRQALAGLLWGKQYYEYDVHRWLADHGVNPWNAQAAPAGVRNAPWFHMVARDVISMPDTWEYPWFAAWDLAFHTAPLSLVDVDFAKEQVELLIGTRYLHPNGQIPAYEWNFSDVNPPVTAWAALYVYEREAEIRGDGRPRVPRACVRATADELHLVGQPQGPR